MLLRQTFITTQATKLVLGAYKTARLGTQLSNIHASPDAFTNFLIRLRDLNVGQGTGCLSLDTLSGFETECT